MGQARSVIARLAPERGATEEQRRAVAALLKLGTLGGARTAARQSLRGAAASVKAKGAFAYAEGSELGSSLGKLHIPTRRVLVRPGVWAVCSPTCGTEPRRDDREDVLAETVGLSEQYRTWSSRYGS